MRTYSAVSVYPDGKFLVRPAKTLARRDKEVRCLEATDEFEAEIAQCECCCGCDQTRRLDVRLSAIMSTQHAKPIPRDDFAALDKEIGIDLTSGMSKVASRAALAPP
jgi:hypothetical protein